MGQGGGGVEGFSSLGKREGARALRGEEGLETRNGREGVKVKELRLIRQHD